MPTALENTHKHQELVAHNRAVLSLATRSECLELSILGVSHRVPRGSDPDRAGRGTSERWEGENKEGRRDVTDDRASSHQVQLAHLDFRAPTEYYRKSHNLKDRQLIMTEGSGTERGSSDDRGAERAPWRAEVAKRGVLMRRFRAKRLANSRLEHSTIYSSVHPIYYTLYIYRFSPR